VRAPTLLIVGGNDRDVLGLNRTALAQLRCTKRLEIVAAADHYLPLRAPERLTEIIVRQVRDLLDD